MECLQVIAIAMDVFTDVDIFKEILSAALRGVGVYVLLDDSRVSGFLAMSHSAGVNIHDIKVRKQIRKSFYNVSEVLEMQYNFETDGWKI